MNDGGIDSEPRRGRGASQMTYASLAQLVEQMFCKH